MKYSVQSVSLIWREIKCENNETENSQNSIIRQTKVLVTNYQLVSIYYHIKKYNWGINLPTSNY